MRTVASSFTIFIISTRIPNQDKVLPCTLPPTRQSPLRFDVLGLPPTFHSLTLNNFKSLLP